MTFLQSFPSNSGYYDDNGRWQRTKFCFVACGNRCDCGPPGGAWYSASHDKNRKDDDQEDGDWKSRPDGGPK